MSASLDNLVGVLSAIACFLVGFALLAVGTVVGAWLVMRLAHWTFRRQPERWLSRCGRLLAFAMVLAFACAAFHTWSQVHAPSAPDERHIHPMNNHGDVRYFTTVQFAFSMEGLGPLAFAFCFLSGALYGLALKCADPAYLPPTFCEFTRPLREWIWRYHGVMPDADVTPGPSPPTPAPSARARTRRRGNPRR